MKFKYIFLSLFKLYKFNIICRNDNEYIKVQDYLYNKGYYWEGYYSESSRKYLTTFYPYPVIVKNYRTGDKFGGKILILDDFRHFSKNSKNKYVTLTSLIRKQKLKKIY